MPSPNTVQNRSWPHCLMVVPEPPGQFTAQAVGIPELRATATTREEALQQVSALLSEWMASSRLVLIEVPSDNPLLRFPGHLDPTDSLEQEFMAELERLHRQDLERTLQEDDQKCSDSSRKV